MKETEIYGYSVIAVLIPVLIFLVFILRNMYRTGLSYGRKIPIPPEHLRKNRGIPRYPDPPPPPPLKPCIHGFDIKEVMNLQMDPRCKKCGERLSEVRKKTTITN